MKEFFVVAPTLTEKAMHDGYALPRYEGLVVHLAKLCHIGGIPRRARLKGLAGGNCKAKAGIEQDGRGQGIRYSLLEFQKMASGHEGDLSGWCCG